MPVENHWDTLTSTPIYVEPKGSLTVGFVGSKQGAEAGKWHTFGNANGTSDNREGWWCATDFVLKYHAIDDLTGINSPSQTAPDEGERSMEDGQCFDLSGRPKAKHQPGISISKGRKTLK